MIKKKNICLLLIMSLMLSVCGCSDTTQEVTGETVELIEPMNAVANTEIAACRNLYDTTIYSAIVYPQVVEYAFTKDAQVDGYAAFLGEHVNVGDALVYADTKALEEKIEKQEEYLADMQEQMEEYRADLAENLADPREDVKRMAGILENLENQEPPKQILSERVSGSDAGMMIDNPAYATWQKDYNYWEGKYRIQAHNVNVQEEGLRQKETYYALDYEYQLSQLNKLKAERKSSTIYSKVVGEVVATAQADYGTLYAEEGVSIVAVGDAEKKVLKSDYISKDVINGAEEVYALIDGVRYEVEYQPISSQEYAKLSAESDKVYSEFWINGDTTAIEAGDFAVIVVTREKKEQVLAISKNALSKDETGYYVYVVKDGENIYTPVKTGISDGVYTEITAGLNAGDAILVEKLAEYSTETVTVEKGSFHSSFEGWGFMYYPMTETVTNEIEYGTVYFEEFMVAQYQHVEKGDVIATIRVVSDEIAIQRNETKLKRAQERLADLRAEGEEKNEDAILKKEEEIADLQELIKDMKADGATKQIVANQTGMVVELANLEAEAILSSGMGIAAIADESTCYVVVENTNLLLNYGNDVTVTYTNAEGISKTVDGTVANVSPAGVSVGLQLNYSFILLPEESIADMAVSNNDRDGWWNRNRYQVKATIREMENVLVVPKKAVKDVAGVTYVNIMDEQGNITPCSFIAGGFDKSGYWVVEGLTEGMKLCLE